MGPAFPNPVTDSTYILIQIPTNIKVKIYIKDEENKLIKTICNDSLEAGMYTLLWFLLIRLFLFNILLMVLIVGVW
jgi:hypothetical protein